jgi:hypothetical protein
VQAKARLDNAKIVLLNPDLRRKELGKFFDVFVAADAERAELLALEGRTRQLEARCEEALAARALCSRSSAT